MSEIQAKRFASIDFHRFPISTDKNHLIAKDFYRFQLLTSPGCNYTRNYTENILKGGRSKSWKTGRLQK